MKKLLLLLLFIPLVSFGQSKKNLRGMILRIQADSTSLQNAVNEKNDVISTLSISNSNLSMSNSNLKQVFSKQLKSQGEEYKSSIADLNDSIFSLNQKLDSVSYYYYKLDSVSNFTRRLDSINNFPITDFVHSFYNSLELSKEENERQYNEGGVNFDLDNFHTLISENAMYSTERVDNLSDDSYHDRYYIGLLSVGEIVDIGGRILVKTKVLYYIYELGSFYNEEVLHLLPNGSGYKLNGWYDKGLYEIALRGYEGTEDFNESDFYKMMGSANK